MVLELAVESRADYLVTFNAKDFRPAVRFGIQVVTPAEFLAILEEGSMTITLTLPDDLYQRVVEIAGRHDVSAERIAMGRVSRANGAMGQGRSASGEVEQRALPRRDGTKCRMWIPHRKISDDAGEPCRRGPTHGNSEAELAFLVLGS